MLRAVAIKLNPGPLCRTAAIGPARALSLRYAAACRTSEWGPPLRRRSVVMPAASGRGFGSESDGRPHKPKLNFNQIAQRTPQSAAEVAAAIQMKQVQVRPGTTSVIMSDFEDTWEVLDEAVNKYPIEREFKAIGDGGLPFVEAMVQIVEEVLGMKIPPMAIRQRPSSGGKYVCVNVGPVLVTNGDQIKAIYATMKRDVRCKWLL